MQYKKWEGPKLAPLKQRSFLIHFLYRTNGDYTWELQKSKTTANPKPRLIDDTQCILNFGCIGVDVAVAFDSVLDFRPLGTKPFV